MTPTSFLCTRVAVRREEGQGMVEYGLILLLVAIVAVVALALIGPKVSNLLTEAANSL